MLLPMRLRTHPETGSHRAPTFSGLRQDEVHGTLVPENPPRRRFREVAAADPAAGAFESRVTPVRDRGEDVELWRLKRARVRLWLAIQHCRFATALRVRAVRWERRAARFLEEEMKAACH